MTSADYSHHFSDKNIPFGIASSAAHENPQAVTRLGNTVIFLNDLTKDLLKDVEGVFNQPTLNAFAALPRSVHQDVRKQIQSAHQKNGLDGFSSASKEDVSAVTMHLPMEIKDFAGKSPILSYEQPLTFQTSPALWTTS